MSYSSRVLNAFSCLCCVSLSCFLVQIVPAAEEGTRNAGSNSAQIGEALRAANHARAQRRDLEAAWESDKQALQLLIDETQRQQKQHNKRHADNKQRTTDLEKDVAHWQLQKKDGIALDAIFLQLAEKCNQELNSLQAQLPSSVVPAVVSAQGVAGDASYVFSQACARLQLAQAACSQWDLSLSSGSLQGESIIVDQLRVGAVAAWWLSRDAQRAGVVQRKNGKNILHLATAQDQKQIRQAFHIAAGEMTPSLVRLPCIPIAAGDERWSR